MTRGARETLVTGFLLAGFLSHSPHLAAQAAGWRLAATADQTWFSDIIDDTSSTEESYDLQPTVNAGVLADHGIGHLRVGIGVSYLVTHLRVIGPLVSIADQEFRFTRWQVAALATVPIVQGGTKGAGLALMAGPALSVWTPTGEDTRTRVTGLASLQLRSPLSSRLSLLASGGGAVSSSPMSDEEMPDGFVVTTLWAWHAGLGLQYGL